MNKSLDIFKEFSLQEVLRSFNKNEIIFQLVTNPNSVINGQFCEVSIDRDEKNDVGLFTGDKCVGSLSSKDILKLIDHDTLKVIKSEQSYNIGTMFKICSVKPISFI